MSFVITIRWQALMLAIGLLWVVFSTAAGSEAKQLNGLSSYTYLGSEQFIAALYCEKKDTHPRQLLLADTAAAMELRVTVKKLRRRNFFRLWAEGMVVNSGLKEITLQEKNFHTFKSFFKGSLLYGDQLILSYTPGNGMQVKLNDVVLGNINSGVFFRLLLSAWIGKVPLSSVFRNELMHPEKISKSLQQRFDKLLPNTDRVAEISHWIPLAPVSETKTSMPDASTVAVSNRSVKAFKESVRKKNVVEYSARPNVERMPVVNKKFKAVDKAPENKAEAPWKQSIKSNESAGISPPDMNSSGMTSIGVKEVDLLGQSFSDQKVLSYSKTMNGISLMPSLTSAIKKKVSSAISTVKDIGKPPAAAEMQPYDSELLRLIYKYKTLPRDAFKHRLEGIARVLVTINRRGEIMDLEFEEKSQYKKLNDQALDAVVRASPFPPVPDYIEGEGYTFSVIMEYKLPY